MTRAPLLFCLEGKAKTDNDDKLIESFPRIFPLVHMNRTENEATWG